MNRPLRAATLLIGAQLAVAVSFGLSGIIGWHGSANAATGPIPMLSNTLRPCANEDGNVDGLVCAWTDPDTGDLYIVDSDNYRGTCWRPVANGSVVQVDCDDAIGPVTP